MMARAFDFVTPEGKRFADFGNPAAVRLREALTFLENIPPYEAPADDFNPNAMKVPPYDFFKGHVEKIVVDVDPRSDVCADGRLAFVRESFREEKKIYVCWLVERYDALTVSTTLVHEARHLEGQEFQHRNCFVGPNRGKDACDDSYAQGGSYGIELEYLVKLARNPKLSPETRQRARAAAVRDFVSRFNEAPLDITEGALLEREDGALVFYDGDKTRELPIPRPPNGVLALRGGLPTFFEKERVTEYEFAPELGSAFPDVLVRDQLANHHDLLDVVYGIQYACLLTPAKLRCYKPDRTVVERALEFEPESFVFSPSSRVIGAGAIYVRDRAGVQHLVPENFEDEMPTAGFGLRAIAPWPGGEMSLEADGRAHVLSYRSRRWSDGPAGQYRRLFAPFSWSQRLNELLSTPPNG